MALEGSLKDLSVPDVFELIATQSKSGVLTIVCKTDEVELGFKNGMITDAFHKEEHQYQLEGYLLKSRRILKEEFARIKKSEKETGMPLDEILIKEGYMKEEEFKDLIRFKIQDIVEDVFIWTEGNYRFDSGAEIYSKSWVKVEVNTRGLLMKAAERIDEWPRIMNKFSSGDIFVIKTEKIPPELESAEEKVLSFLDRRKTVSDLVDLCGMGKFETHKLLFVLLQKGAIRRVGIKKAIEKKELRFNLAEIMTNALWIVGILAFLGANILVGIYVRKNLLKVREIPIFNLFSFIESQEGMERVENSLRLYFLKHGRYPENLSRLKRDGLIEDRVIHSFEYKPSRDVSSYKLSKRK